MLAWLLTIPLELRCVAVFLLGTIIGGQLNRGIYRLAWDAKAIGPWSKADPKAPPRTWLDRVPIVGWFGLRRETPLHGRGFWIRPLLIEFCTGLGLAYLYYWEVTGQLIPPLPPALMLGDMAVQDRLHWRFVSHGLLICLMTVATFIDFDEKTIPDWITVPGTLVGLILAALVPQSLPAILNYGPPPLMPIELGELWLTAPNLWEPRLDAWEGLFSGLFCIWGWCFAMQPKLWTLRRGWTKAFVYLGVSLVRYPLWWITPLIGLLSTPAIVAVWMLGGVAWQGLLTALVGMAFGGGLVWSVRVIGTSALGKEAMGFGDVTLMAMIGAFVGWQGTLVTFFVAPFAALGIALAQFILTRRHEIAFGPYLCAGALYVLLRWPEVWDGIGPIFQMGLLIPAIVAVCLVLMWGMLKVWGTIKRLRGWE